MPPVGLQQWDAPSPLEAFLRHHCKPEKKVISSSSAMAYQLYRNTTLGNSLQESLDELIQSQQITPQLALRVLLSLIRLYIQHWLKGSRKVNFRGSLNMYRFCDNV
jgi:hypothetical protein